MQARAEITDFWELVFNPSSMERLSHTVGGAWITGAFLVMSVAAYYLLKNKHVEFAKLSMKIGLFVALFASLLQLFTGHQSGVQVADTQPAKLAAFEGHYETSPGDLYIFGWVNEETQEVVGLKLPGMLSWLIWNDSSKPVTGLNEFPPEDRPPVNIIFQTYHIMVAIGMFFIGFTILGVFLLWRGKLFDSKWYLKIMVPAVVLPHLANQLGWISAEIGRQPWIVYGLLRTSDGISKAVTGNQVLFSLILFTLIYVLLFVLFLFLLDRKIKHGPENPDEMDVTYSKQKLAVKDNN